MEFPEARIIKSFTGKTYNKVQKEKPLPRPLPQEGGERIEVRGQRMEDGE